MDITKIDKNFLVQSNLRCDNIRIYDACQEPFRMHGLLSSDGEQSEFCRMPKEIAKTVSDNVYALNLNTAGGRVRFATDSSYIAVLAEMDNIGKMPHFALTGSAGFDLYRRVGENEEYITTFIPPYDIENKLTAGIELHKNQMCEYTINFPLYSGVRRLYIILSDDAQVNPPRTYTHEKPIVYYGSSITQGGCASRPGNSYQAIISQRLDCDYINLGFSGSARAEDEIANYIAELEMSAFVYDYDHNAPNFEHLQKTHSRMFNIIRKKNPLLPIICISAPSLCTDKPSARRDVIKQTVETAKQNGDNNVWFIDMVQELKNCGIYENAFVDGCHPNDLGFYFMAYIIERRLKENL